MTGARRVAQRKHSGPSEALRFGHFQVNAAGDFVKNGTRVHLPRQLFRILSVLLAKRGQVVAREEMRRKLWEPGTFVDFEHNLNSAIKKLRTALGDSTHNPQYIETIPGIGHRFVARVKRVKEHSKR